jgi:hypothetical protein
VVAGIITSSADTTLRRAGGARVVQHRNEAGTGTLAIFGLYNPSTTDPVTIERVDPVAGSPSDLSLQARVTLRTDNLFDLGVTDIVNLPGPLPFPPGAAGRWLPTYDPAARIPPKRAAEVVIGGAATGPCVSLGGVRIMYLQSGKQQELDVPLAVNAGC